MITNNGFRLDRPSSPKAVQRVWEAYDEIPEKDKKRLLKILHQKKSEMFLYLLKQGGFPSGLSPTKVENRELTYGKKVDKILKSHRDGRFGEDALFTYLIHWKSGPAMPLLKALVGSATKQEAERRLDNYLDENAEDPLSVLGVRFFQAFINLEGNWIHTDLEEDVDGRVTVDSECPPVQPETATADGSDHELEALDPGESTETSLITDLDKALDEVVCLADSARVATPWAQDDWEAVVLGAKIAVERVRDEIERMAGNIGRKMPKWQSRRELKELLDTLRKEGASQARKELLATFLWGLADEIRTLVPLHKLASKRMQQATLCDAAADEITASSAIADVAWPKVGPDEPRAWLEWVRQLDGNGLEDLIANLSDAAYPHTALLMEDLERNYAMGKGSREIAETEPRQAEEVKPLGGCQNSTKPAKPTHTPQADSLARKRPQEPPVVGGCQAPEQSIAEPRISETIESRSNLGREHRPVEPGRPLHEEEPHATDQENAASKDTMATSDSTVPSPEPPSAAEPKGQNIVVTCPDGNSNSSTEIFQTLGDLQEAASTALRVPETQIESAIEKVIWNLIALGERTLACQILRNAHDTGLTSSFPLPPATLEILALLPAYSSNSSEVPSRIRYILQNEDFSGIFKDGESKINQLRRLLLASALLRPSLFDPTSSAGALLEGIHFGNFPGLHTISHTLAEFGRQGVDLNATILSATLNARGWKESESEIVASVKRFQEEALARKIKYMPATRIWIHWFQSREGWMKRLFSLATGMDRKSMDALAAALKSVDIDAEIDRVWNGFKTRGQLMGAASESLRRLTNEALDLIRRRLDHWKSGSHGDDDYRQKVLGEMAETVMRNLPSARHELEAVLADGGMGVERCGIAAQLMLEELNYLNDALSGNKPHVECSSISEWMRADLLRLDSIDLDESMEIDREPIKPEDGLPDFWLENDPARNRLARELMSLRHPILDWPQSFENSLSRNDHRSARWILDQMARMADPAIVRLESRKAAHAEETRNRLRRDLKAAEAKLGSAFSKGWLTPGEHVRSLETVQRMLEGLSDQNDWHDQPFDRWFEDLAVVLQRVDLALKEQIHIAELSLKALPQNAVGDIARVRRVLDNGDLQLASEYIQKIQSGESIDDTEEINETNHFQALFGDKSCAGYFQDLIACLGSTNPTFDSNQAIADIQSNDSWCGIDLRSLESGSRAASAGAMQRWFVSQKARKIDEKAVETILRAFDLPISSVSHSRDGFVANLAGDISCPIPDFGSEIRLRKIPIHVEFQRSSADDMVQHLERLKIGTTPTILLWIRPVPMAIRRKFSRLCRQKSMKVLLIDTVLAAYVLTVESPRTRALLECSLPFTNVAPYATTGGMLPEEMFFGRRREIEAIESAGQAGTCFVYGGRQIGKTVLLRKVERDFVNRGKQHVALYLDLNFHAVGQTVSMDEIWRIVADELSKKDSSIFGKTTRSQFAVEHFSANITEWLKQDEERRVLLLLDEADRFLEADSKDSNEGHGPTGMTFRICQQLKGLMDSTHRRFKVVFAGLHNVQRSTRVANNPLAQLGIPVCVGPLYQNGESREAARLVSVPLAVSGMFFDSVDTINTILARTNYYPNLIQIFCSRLLSLTVDKQSRSHPDQTPPFTVTSEDVENVFAKHEIRDEIRKKFMLTLDLDRRFSLIAHYMALMAKEYPGGFSTDDIQQDAVPWWPAGFEADRQRPRDSLHEDLAVLLSEMCGLGILRRDLNDRFFLRSPNVVALLGSPSEIERVLDSAASWEVPPPYSPDSFRRPTTGLGDHFHWRSCLTARQETLIRESKNQVILISGCQASGIDEVVQNLNLVMGSDYLKPLPPESSLNSFEKFFGTLANREKQAGKTMILVPADSNWSLDWVVAARRLLSRFTAKDRPVGVVFLADSKLIWANLPEWKAILREIGTTGHLKLQRWDNAALRQWLTDSGVSFDNLSWLQEATGGWHEIIRVLGEFVHHGGSIESLCESGEQPLDVLRKRLIISESFGLSNALAYPVMEILAEFGESVSDEMLHQLYNSQVAEHVSKKIAPTLEWAEAVGVVESHEGGWLIDGFVGSLINANAINP